MNMETLSERLRSLSGSQQSIQSLSATCVRQPGDAKEIVLAWRTECEQASPERKLIYLYLANDILQNSRKQGSAFADEFVTVVPRTVRQVYKSGPEGLRKAVSRLVGIWEERKVLASSAIKMMRECLKREVRETRRSGVTEKEEGARKRFKATEPLAKGAWEAEAAAKRTVEWQNNHQSAVEKGILSDDTEQLEMARKQLGCYATALKAEITARKHYTDLLRNCIQEQEQAGNRAQDILRMCLIQQGTVAKSLEACHERMVGEPYSPTPPQMGSPSSPSPPQHDTEHSLLPPIPAVPQPLMQQPDQPQVLHPPPFPAPPSVMRHQQLSQPQTPLSCGTPHNLSEGVQVPPPPPPPPLPPAFPMKQNTAPISHPQWNVQPPKPANYHGFDGGLAPTPPPPHVNGTWQVQQYPMNQNGDLDVCSDVANQLAASTQPASVLASALGTLPQEKQEEFGFSVASSLNQPQFGYNNARNWST